MCLTVENDTCPQGSFETFTLFLFHWCFDLVHEALPAGRIEVH